MKNLLFLFGIIFVFSFGCETEEPEIDLTGFDSEQAMKEIKLAYYSWGSASQEKDSETMYNLSYPDGNFEGRTKVCIDQWSRGNTLYYSFSELEFETLYEDYALVKGTIDMIQGSPNFKNKFTSSARYSEGKWLLDGITTGELITTW